MFNGSEGEDREQKDILKNLPWKKLLLLFAGLLVFLSFRFFIDLKLNSTWFDILGYSSVFWRTFLAKVLFGGGVFAAVTILNLLNIFLVYKVVKKPFSFPLALLVALFAGTIVVGNSSELWMTYLKFANTEAFAVTDPQFGLDVGFYVFKLPFLWVIYKLLNSWLVINLITSIAFYLLLLPRGIEMSSRNITRRIFSGAEKRGFSHVGILLGLIMVLQTLRYKLATYELLYSQVGSVIGAGASDIGASLPANYIMMVFSTLFGLFIVVTFPRRIRLSLLAIGVYFALAILLTGVYPTLYQKLVIDPDELGNERPFLEQNIKYTRLAYGLDKLTEVEYPVGDLTYQDLQKNQDIIDNIRLLDQRATMSTYAQQQEIRLYYDFVDVDVDRYMIDGRLTQVLLAGRELNQASLPEQAQTFNNLMFKYTHGFGLAMSPANEITESGLPQYLIKDIPPQSDVFNITEPRIYFGEATDNNVIVNTGLKEFDYPMGDDNQEYIYQGKKGIPMTFLNKLLLTMRDVQFKYLLSNYITPQSQYLETRNVVDRATRIAPFLSYDRDPYIVLGEDGKIYYILDAYTSTDMYPYSQAADETGRYNYLRNSVKVLVDAYSGDIGFYIFDQEDPLVRVYSNIYPELFKNAAEFPQDLKSHVRYPEDLFMVQSMILRDYHMNNPTVFYNREDRWEFAQETYQEKQIVQEPYYSINRLPGEEKEEFILMGAYTPARKQNLVAWLAGRADGDNYGKLLLYKFPKGLQIPGTIQVESLIDQDSVISSQLTLWGQGGSRILRGNLLVYPLGGSLLYIEPLYIEAEQNKFPQLKKIFVFYKDQIVMENTLDEALATLFGTAPPASSSEEDEGGITEPPVGNEQELIRQIISLYREGQERLKTGDWAAYGRIQQEIDGIIRVLEERQR